jgi:hypothetical protein
MGKLLSRSDSGDSFGMQARMAGIIKMLQQPDGTSHNETGGSGTMILTNVATLFEEERKLMRASRARRAEKKQSSKRVRREQRVPSISGVHFCHHIAPQTGCEPGATDGSIPVSSAEFIYIFLGIIEYCSITSTLPLNVCFSLMPNRFVHGFHAPLRCVISAWLLMHNLWVSPNVSSLHTGG